MTTTVKRLSDLENPMQLDAENPIFVIVAGVKAKLIGYSPANTYAPFPVFHILPEGSKPGYEKMIKDAEIILN